MTSPGWPSAATRSEAHRFAGALVRATAAACFDSCERSWFDGRRDWAWACLARRASRDQSRKSARGAQGATGAANLLRIIAGELSMGALFAGTGIAVGSHQRQLVPAKQGIEVHGLSPAVSGSALVSQPLALTRAVPAILSIWLFKGPIVRAGVRCKWNRAFAKRPQPTICGIGQPLRPSPTRTTSSSK